MPKLCREPPRFPSPGWFNDFLADRAMRAPSPHITKAYRQDFEAIAIMIAGTADAVAGLQVNEVTKSA